MTDSVVARDREHELVRVLEKIFCERCGFNLKVHPAYRKPVESKGRKNSELRILEEARQILLHSKVGNKNGDRETGEDLSGQGMEAPLMRPDDRGRRKRTETTGEKSTESGHGRWKTAGSCTGKRKRGE